MGLKLKREKHYGVWVKIFYLLKKLLPLSPKNKLKLFLNLEWIFWRFALEESSRIYEGVKHPLREKAMLFLSQYLKKEYNVLDLGCARGEVTRRVSEHVNKVKALDYNQIHIDVAKEKNQRDNIEYICGEALDFLKNNDTKFDVLILSHILEHLDDPDEFLSMYKGYFDYIYIELPDFEKSYSNIYRQELNMSLNFTDGDHISEFDRDEMLELTKKNKIEIIGSEYKFGFQRHWCKVIH